MNLEELAAACGMDLEATLKRFSGNEGLLLRFVKKFAGDTTFEQLKEAVAQEDYPKIETTAHTLKGVAGNLGFQELFACSDQIVKAVRAGEYDQVGDLFLKDQEIYQGILAAIEKLN